MMTLGQRQLRHQVGQGIPRDQVQLLQAAPRLCAAPTVQTWDTKDRKWDRRNGNPLNGHRRLRFHKQNHETLV